MSKFVLNRRRALFGAAAITALSPAQALAQRDAGPGGFSRSGIARIPGALQARIDDGSAVGMVTLLYRRGEIAQVNALGMANKEQNVPMRRDTIFRIASMSKPVTAAAAMTLVDQGRMGLNDPVDRWLPELANRVVLNDPNGPLNATHPSPRPITVSDLMTMRSGLAGGGATPLGQAYRENLSYGAFHPATLTADEWLQRIGRMPLIYDPNTRWYYGESTTALGALVARVSGMSFGDYLKQSIFDPLGMPDTGLWVAPEKVSRVATVYGRNAQTFERTPEEIPVPQQPLAFGAGAGGMFSTVDDYLKFARMLLGRGAVGTTRVLTRRSVALMTTNWLTDEQRAIPSQFGPDFFAGQGFGLSLAVVDNPSMLGRLPYASTGSFYWAGAFGGSWIADPSEDMVTLYLVQNSPSLTGQNLARPVPNQPPPTPPVAVFTGLAYSSIAR